MITTPLAATRGIGVGVSAWLQDTKRTKDKTPGRAFVTFKVYHGESAPPGDPMRTMGLRDKSFRTATLAPEASPWAYLLPSFFFVLMGTLRVRLLCHRISPLGFLRTKVRP